jgi:HrpA-like RNA helicase
MTICFQVVPITKSSAEQRKGRAGRTSPGTCYRLYCEDDFNAMRDGNVPEIKKRPLGLTIINLLAMKINIATFNWIEPPEKEAVDYALKELIYLGGITPNLELTELGKLMAELQVEPGIARMLHWACNNGFGMIPFVKPGTYNVR